MIIDDVKKMAEKMTPKEMERRFAKKFKDKPDGLMHAHGMAAHVARTKAAKARTVELRAKVRELMKYNSALSLHEAYRRAGVALGIL